MQGLMQDWPLLVHKVIEHANNHHADQEVVSRAVEGGIHRYTYGELYKRSKRCANALRKLGVSKGDVVATLAWNTYRHVEAWYGIMGLGAVCHTLNPRLFPEQLIYIANHAEDKYLFTDLTFVPLVEKLAPQLKTLKGVIVMTDRAHMPKTSIPNVLCYEDLIADVSDDFEWVEVNENDAAGMCYTSGTTGNPKGVVYSHRSNVLHALMVCQADVMGIKATDSVLPVVPMFHANAWAIAFAAPLVGSKLVMPGAQMDGASIHELLETEKVTFTAAVPTVWLMLLQYLESQNKEITTLKRVAIGGSALPQTILEKFQQRYGVSVMHSWGMTEMSPVGTMATGNSMSAKLSAPEQLALQLKQGRAPFLVEMKIVDDNGKELPKDGKTFGHLVVRGPAIAKSYFKGEGGNILDKDGFFDTNDVAHIDRNGFMQITDRSKDVIKSGGEWISSIEIENIAVGHPEVAEAAVVGIPHPKWDERPLLVVIRKPNTTVTKEAMLAYLEGKIAKWWMPDDVVFVTEIPHTATGKIQKRTLREQYQAHQMTTTVTR